MTLEQKLKHYRLSRSEYDRMKAELGHEPTNIEWALFSALWSEHCSYKSSKVHLRKLFTKHPRVVQGPGENAGVIDLGEGERVAFKMESHNHPSFIEPTQGAATGVGGILRDIFTMGARPIASMDYLCFGEPGNEHTPRLLSGVIGGIGGYGNCVGVPTVNGQTTFHESYNGNILVNAFSLGLFRPGEKIFYGKASGIGNWIVYVGARTGRDGVHGAAMASESFDDDLEKKKPNVQIGDPFYEKLLIEACLEVMNEDLVVGIQDMGAAGLTSSSFEMAARANSGLLMDLSKVPLREPDITPEEILLSESQERMLLIVEPSKFEKVKRVCERWDLSAEKIGEIIPGKTVKLMWQGKLLSEVPVDPLVNKAPIYERPFKIPEPRRTGKPNIPDEENFNEQAVRFLSSPSMTSREYIYHQYDQRVGAKTVLSSGEPVGLLQLPDSKRALGMGVGCRPLVMEADPHKGAQDAVALPTLQLASRGVKALAVTDCLNFGNPEKPEIMGEFVAALQGMNEACEVFDAPIISGNVSLYNETLGKSIIGTPAIGIVGVGSKIDDNQRFSPQTAWTHEGLDLYLVETPHCGVWLGEFARFKNLKPGELPALSLKEARDLQNFLLHTADLVDASLVIGRGGLFPALAKMAGMSGLGAQINYFETGLSATNFLFAERFYASVIAVNPDNRVRFLEAARGSGVKVAKIGETGGESLRVNHYLEIKVESLKSAYGQGLRRLVEKLA